VADESRVVTVPNLITLARLALVPVFLYLLFWTEPTRRMAAAYLLGFLGATDWVDGYVARRFHQVSTLGKVLDPVADRVLLGVAIVAIMIDGSAPIWLGTLVIVREVLVSVAVLVLAGMGAKRIDVQWVGKAGTLALMFAFPLFLVGNSPDCWWQGFGAFCAWGFAIPGLVLSWYAALTYIPIARRALAEGRVVSARDDAP
jgi:cardiolipin synthase